MTTTITFDTLKFATHLKNADVPEKQAQAQAEALREVINETLVEQSRKQAEATARAVVNLDTKTEAAIAGLKAELKADIGLLRKDVEALEQRLNARIDASGKDLTIKMGGMFIVAIGILLAGMRYLLAQ